MSRLQPAIKLVCWAIGASVVAVLRNRIWATPNLAFFSQISQNLGHNPFSPGFNGDYLVSNLSGPVVARTLGQTEPYQYARLHLLALIVGLGLTIWLTFRRFGYRPARNLAIVISLAPASTVALEWLGQPDALTYPLALALVLMRRRWAVTITALLLALTHFEQGIAIAAIACLARQALLVSADADSAGLASTELQLTETQLTQAPSTEVGRGVRGLVTEAWPMLTGLIIGRLVIEAYLRLSEISIATPRTSFLKIGVSGFAEHHSLAGGWLPYGLWGPLWFVVAGLFVVAFLQRAALERSWVLGASLCIAGAIAGLAPMLITLDQTRVYSLATAPLLVAAAVLADRLFDRMKATNRPSLSFRTRAFLVTGLAATCLIPGMFTAGEPYFSTDLPSREFGRFLVDGTHPGDLTKWLLGPFGFDVEDR